MRVARTVEELRAALSEAPTSRRSLGLVPTMGALHDGHVSLLRAAKASCERVVMSVFVNPLQFGPTEDFASYPRDEARDLDIARREAVDVAFVPPVDEMYPDGASATVSVGRLAEIVEGRARPGHFDGVCTVVAKLLNTVAPTHAFFGQKDAQQVAVVRKMVADLFFPVEIVVCPTVREPDGLAMSSRNRYLASDDRVAAASLSRALELGRAALRRSVPTERVEAEMRAALEGTPGVTVDYAVAVDPDTFETIEPDTPGDQVLLAVAARVGGTRLIDNVLDERGAGDASGG